MFPGPLQISPLPSGHIKNHCSPLHVPGALPLSALFVLCLLLVCRAPTIYTPPTGKCAREAATWGRPSWQLSLCVPGMPTPPSLRLGPPLLCVSPLLFGCTLPRMVLVLMLVFCSFWTMVFLLEMEKSYSDDMWVTWHLLLDGNGLRSVFFKMLVASRVLVKDACVQPPTPDRLIYLGRGESAF